MTPITCAKPLPPKGRSPSFPTSRHERLNIRLTSISKRPPDITATSSLSQPSSYGCGKCPHHLALFNAHRVRRDGPKVARADRSHSFGVKQMGARDARNPHVAYGVEGAGNVVWVGTPGPQRAPALDATDEQGWETERCRMAEAMAPILDSTVDSQLESDRDAGNS